MALAQIARSPTVVTAALPVLLVKKMNEGSSSKAPSPLRSKYVIG
jgi:hypothetical protein